MSVLFIRLVDEIYASSHASPFLSSPSLLPSRQASRIELMSSLLLPAIRQCYAGFPGSRTNVLPPLLLLPPPSQSRLVSGEREGGRRPHSPRLTTTQRGADWATGRRRRRPPPSAPVGRRRGEGRALPHGSGVAQLRVLLPSAVAARFWETPHEEFFSLLWRWCVCVCVCCVGHVVRVGTCYRRGEKMLDCWWWKIARDHC